LINIKGNDSIAAVTKVMKEDEVEGEEGDSIEADSIQEESSDDASEAPTEEGQE
jgi:DNA gyrase subunit A